MEELAMNISQQYLTYVLDLFELRQRLDSEVSKLKESIRYSSDTKEKDNIRTKIETIESKVNEITNDIYIRLDIIKD